MRERGFTLIELIIAIAIIVILLTSLFPFVFNKISRSDVGASMRGFVSNLYPELSEVKISASDRDSDHNGYYSCTATGLDENGERKTIVAECDGRGNCRPILDR